MFAREAAAFVGAQEPLLVVANHGWLTFGLTRSQQRYGLRCAVLSFVTEPLDASALWVEPNAERFVAPSHAVKADLVRLGVAPYKIDVVGYPVKQAFFNTTDKARARGHLGLEDRFTCLFSLGGEGVSRPLLPWLDALLEFAGSQPSSQTGSQDAPQIVVITGRNEQLRRELTELVATRPQLHVRGFVTDIASYLAASDVVVGKAGPASVFEALAVGRPFLVTGYAGLNERAVLRFLTAQGLGRAVRSPVDLAGAVAAYRSDPNGLERVHSAARALRLEEMSHDLAHYLVHYAYTRRAPAASTSQPTLQVTPLPLARFQPGLT